MPTIKDHNATRAWDLGSVGLAGPWVSSLADIRLMI